MAGELYGTGSVLDHPVVNRPSYFGVSRVVTKFAHLLQPVLSVWYRPIIPKVRYSG